MYEQNVNTYPLIYVNDSYIFMVICGTHIAHKQDGDNKTMLGVFRVLVLPISLTHSFVYAGIMGTNTI